MTKPGNQLDYFQRMVQDIERRKDDRLLLNDILRYTRHGVIYLKSFKNDEGKPVDFECLLFNDEAARLSKKCPEQLKNARLSTFLDPRWFPHFFAVLSHTLETGEIFSEIRNYSAASDEPPLWAAINISRLNDGVLVNVHDITDQVILNDELHHTNEYLKSLNGEKDEILSALTHDLRGPLSGIMGLLQLLRSERLDEQERGEYQSMLETSALKMENMLVDMLNWQNSRQNGTANETEINLRQEVSRILEEMVQAQHKRVSLLNNVSSEYTWQGNQGMVCSILRNLIGNAVKFSHSDSEVHIDAAPDEKGFVLSFQDFGVGMNQEQIHNLLYGGIPSSTLGTVGEKGTGMGIRIIRGFIERMGGELSIESTPGKGSRFKVMLPLKH